MIRQRARTGVITSAHRVPERERLFRRRAASSPPALSDSKRIRLEESRSRSPAILGNSQAPDSVAGATLSRTSTN